MSVTFTLSLLAVVGSIVLWRSAFNFTVDASPVGSMMIAASAFLFVLSLFLLGIHIGHLTA